MLPSAVACVLCVCVVYVLCVCMCVCVCVCVRARACCVMVYKRGYNLCMLPVAPVEPVVNDRVCVDVLSDDVESPPAPINPLLTFSRMLTKTSVMTIQYTHELSTYG